MYTETLGRGFVRQAEYYAAPPVESLADIARRQPITDPEQLRTRGEALDSFLGQELTALQGTLVDSCSPEHREELLSLIAEVDRGDEAALRRAGLDLRQCRLYDVTSAMLCGMPVQIEALAGLSAVVEDQPAGIMVYADEGLASHPPSMVALAALLRRSNEVVPTHRQVISIDDRWDQVRDVTGKTLYADQADQLVVDLMFALEKQGILYPNDVPGRDYLVTRRADCERMAADCLREGRLPFQESKIYGLRQSVFELSPAVLATLHPSLGSGLSRAAGLPLAQVPHNEHRINYNLANAMRFHSPISKAVVHLSFQQRAESIALAQALDLVRPENVHNIPVSQGNTWGSPLLYDNPLLTTYAFARVWHASIQEHLADLERFASFDDMNHHGYVSHNYGDGTGTETGRLPEDEAIISVVIEALYSRFHAGGITGRVLEIGADGNDYLAMCAQPFLAPAPHASLEAGGFTAAARAYKQGYKDGTQPSEFAGIGPKFQQYIESLGLPMFFDTNDRTRQRLQVEYGDIFNIPEGTYQLILEGFVAGSVRRELSEYVRAIRSKSAALTDDGFSIGLEMLNRKSWSSGREPNGKLIEHPSTYLTPELVGWAHNAVGLEVYVVPISAGQFATTSEDQGYGGMAVVVAWPKRGSDGKRLPVPGMLPRWWEQPGRGRSVRVPLNLQ